MGILILLTAVLAIGGACGYYFGTYFIKKENETLKTQLSLLEKYSSQWSETAINNNHLYQSIAEQNSSNLSSTINNVVQLLQRIQISSPQNQNSLKEEKEIEDIINKVKNLSSP